jgi:hypothetical protein
VRRERTLHACTVPLDFAEGEIKVDASQRNYINGLCGWVAPNLDVVTIVHRLQMTND